MYYFLYIFLNDFLILAGNLFAAQPQQQNSGTSLFGQPNQSVPTNQQPSLFGGSNSMGMGNQGNMPAPALFGSIQPASNAFSGFGVQNQQQPAQQSSLFGGSQMNSGAGFLAGQNPNQGTSIFGSKYYKQNLLNLLISLINFTFIF